jgi:integrase
MSVKVRPYAAGGWEVDIRFRLPDGTAVRERTKNPMTGKASAQRWGEARERELMINGKPRRVEPADLEKEDRVPTFAEFVPRFLDGYARANREKPSAIATRQSILRVHLVPRFGDTPLDHITTEGVQRLKGDLGGKAAKTVNNVLTVLNVLLKAAVAWGVIDRLPCSVTLVRTTAPAMRFHDFAAYEQLVDAARTDGTAAFLIVLLGGEAGLRCGEIMALEWTDVDLAKRQLTVARSEWKGHVTTPKGGRLRYVPLTHRLAEALREARHLRGARVLLDGDRKPLTQKVVQGIVARTARRAHIAPGVHVLRHTFCSHRAMKGAPARAIQELAGHRGLMTTHRNMHLRPAALEAAIGLLDRPTGRGRMVEAAGK